jgi:hypothetical protein
MRSLDSLRNQALAQACAVCSLPSWVNERYGDFSPSIVVERLLSMEQKRKVSREELAATYLLYYSLKRQQDWWAWEEVDSLVRLNPSEAWEVTRILVKTASSDEALAYVAAGPLEDLLTKHGPVVIEYIENESQQNERLQLALSGVWGLDRSNPVFDRWYALMWKYGFAEGKRRPL